MEQLTHKQQKVLKYIEGRLGKANPPSQREIAAHFGLAQNSVFQLIGYLKKKGYLANSPTTSGHRGLRLSKEYLEFINQTKGVPIVGTVAAGMPILAEENIEGYADLNEMFALDGDMFILRVKGDSMVDEGIMDGDFVAVKPASKISQGKIAVVLLNDEATVKRVYIKNKRIALEPANKAAGYKTMYIKQGSESVRIVGIVTGCFRKL